MKINMGKPDKTVRIIAGIIILAAGYYYQSWWGAIGAVPLLTGLFNFCPAYAPFKFSTAKKETTE